MLAYILCTSLLVQTVLLQTAEAGRQNNCVPNTKRKVFCLDCQCRPDGRKEECDLDACLDNLDLSALLGLRTMPEGVPSY
uniref:Pacifastin domain-containing protein n=1 Tax=Timema bartmani TaxID=61472 RepID=A0A7R9F9V8_9NEOP|nr:unnamed protein product [Timema bartmani]